jgi:trafficking protein particle complex subunit 13
VLALTNEASTALSDVVLSVDVQTVTAKVAIATFGPADGTSGATLHPASTLECAVAHEVKELGQHVLACAVSYRAPPGARPPTASDPGADPGIHTFRKFYKFAVTNPLSVKTKTHMSRAPPAILSATERDKVFLEVHLASGAPGPLAFERVKLMPAPGWICYASDAPEPAIAGLVHPQDVRQAIFTLTPEASDAGLERMRAEKAPGSIIPLGQLDIAWRSAFGEPGHLVTSVRVMAFCIA